MVTYFTYFTHFVEAFEVCSPAFKVVWIRKSDIQSDLSAIGVHADALVHVASVLHEMWFVIIAIFHASWLAIFV